jgi:hypothetical protein
MNNEGATVEGCWLRVEWKAPQGGAGERNGQELMGKAES